MSKLRVHCFTLSLDGYGAGPDQGSEAPVGIGAEGLHQWMFDTPSFRRRVLGEDGGTPGINEDFVARSFESVGAWIMGRNMFGPVRGPWPDDSWKGWWGDAPPFHTEVFVLTRHPRASLEMKGGTVFHFVTDDIHAALERARAVAGDRDVRVGGGVSTLRQYLQAGLVDEMHLAVAPVVMGKGENLLQGLDLPACGLGSVTATAGEHGISHYTLRRSAD
ncbi:dihydrofolate reductase family protein [Stappia sp. WLB 29]|uniref:dihydrofolate reductase family protein n=1 Tax=Stappia sp. WLB 29 TaxID=2925220 RepID=UPI0020C0E97C|nr:dihydrofolate reductase family protein [Stappia sp. WLB 29]